MNGGGGSEAIEASFEGFASPAAPVAFLFCGGTSVCLGEDGGGGEDKDKFDCLDSESVSSSSLKTLPPLFHVPKSCPRPPEKHEKYVFFFSSKRKKSKTKRSKKVVGSILGSPGTLDGWIVFFIVKIEGKLKKTLHSVQFLLRNLFPD